MKFFKRKNRSSLPITAVSKSEVVQRAVELVKSARKTLLVTMILNREKGRVPLDYEKALDKALKRGIKVTRICFGSQRDMLRYGLSFDKRIKTGLVEQVSLYQRMIVVDKDKMMFGLSNGSFYTSNNRLVIEAFTDYIKLLV